MTTTRRAMVNESHMLFIVTLALVAVGIIMVFSASGVRAQELYNDQNFFLKRHVVYALIGLAGMLVTMNMDYHVWYKVRWHLLLSALALLLTVLFIGRAVGGARRWIDLGFFTLQPSEIAKFAVLVYLASLLKRKHIRIDSLRWVFLPALVVVLATAVLVLAGHDLGTPAVMLMTFLALLFIAGARIKHILGCAGFFMASFTAMVAVNEERCRRIIAFLDPWAHAQDEGFQLVQSFIGFGVGGVLGQGLGEGRQKLFFLPAAHTDFIYSVIGEELGLIGTFSIVILYVLFLCLGLRVALRAKDSFGSFLAAGITLMISFQAFLNIAVVTGLTPTKGLTLPFISYGGNSLIISMISVAVLINIARHQRRTSASVAW